MMSRVTNWTIKFLSYAGRAQLVKHVLFSIQTFWAQIFALPKKIMQAVESICRKFMRTRSVEASNKALIAWERMCWPKSSWGLNFLDLYTWNNAAIWGTQAL